MKFKVFPSGPLFVNTVLVWDENSGKALLVDPGGDLNDIVDVVNRYELEVVYIVNTHEHPDHTAKNSWAKLTFKKAKLVMHELAAENLKFWTESDIGFMADAEYSPPPEKVVSEGDVLEVGDLKFKVIHTPGHSLGSMVLFEESENVAIVGDLIFKGSIGRYDLPMSNYEDLKNSILKFLEVTDKDTLIIPGHGPTTTVKEELLNNPFLKEIF